MRLRYENLVAHPRESIRRVLSLVSEEPPELPFTGERTVTLLPTHSVKGNPQPFPGRIDAS